MKWKYDRNIRVIYKKIEDNVYGGKIESKSAKRYILWVLYHFLYPDLLRVLIEIHETDKRNTFRYKFSQSPFGIPLTDEEIDELDIIYSISDYSYLGFNTGKICGEEIFIASDFLSRNQLDNGVDMKYRYYIVRLKNKNEIRLVRICKRNLYFV